MALITPLQLIADADVAPGMRYVDAAAERRHLSVRIKRTRSCIGIGDAKLAALKSLRLAVRSPRPQQHQLTRTVAGQVRKTQELLSTEIVLPSGNTVLAHPHEIVRIVSEKSIVTPSTYELDGKSAISLDWSTGEHSRIEPYADFSLFAWTCRLSVSQAIRFLQSQATPDGRMIVLSRTDGVFEGPAMQFDRRYVESRAEHVRLLRLENPEQTFLWEIDGHSEDESNRPDFVVMSTRSAQHDMEALIEATGTARIVLAETEILNLARKLGAL